MSCGVLSCVRCVVSEPCCGWLPSGWLGFGRVTVLLGSLCEWCESGCGVCGAFWCGWLHAVCGRAVSIWCVRCACGLRLKEAGSAASWTACLCCVVVFVGLCGGWLMFGVGLRRVVLGCGCFWWLRAVGHAVPGPGGVAGCVCLRRVGCCVGRLRNNVPGVWVRGFVGAVRGA